MPEYGGHGADAAGRGREQAQDDCGIGGGIAACGPFGGVCARGAPQGVVAAEAEGDGAFLRRAGAVQGDAVRRGGEPASLPILADALENHEHADQGRDDQNLDGRGRTSPLRSAELCDHAGEMPIQGLRLMICHADILTILANRCHRNHCMADRRREG